MPGKSDRSLRSGKPVPEVGEKKRNHRKPYTVPEKRSNSMSQYLIPNKGVTEPAVEENSCKQKTQSIPELELNRGAGLSESELNTMEDDNATQNDQATQDDHATQDVFAENPKDDVNRYSTDSISDLENEEKEAKSPTRATSPDNSVTKLEQEEILPLSGTVSEINDNCDSQSNCVQCEDKKDTIERQSADIDGYLTDIQDLSSEMSNMSNEYVQLKADYDKAMEELREQRTKILEKDQMNSSLQRRINQLKKGQTLLSDLKKGHQNETDTLKKRINIENQRFRTYEQLLKAKTSELEALVQKCTSYEKQLDSKASMSSDINDLKDMIKYKDSENIAIKITLNESVDKLAQLRSDLAEKDKTINNLQTQTLKPVNEQPNTTATNTTKNYSSILKFGTDNVSTSSHYDSCKLSSENIQIKTSDSASPYNISLTGCVKHSLVNCIICETESDRSVNVIKNQAYVSNLDPKPMNFTCSKHGLEQCSVCKISDKPSINVTGITGNRINPNYRPRTDIFVDTKFRDSGITNFMPPTPPSKLKKLLFLGDSNGSIILNTLNKLNTNVMGQMPKEYVYVDELLSEILSLETEEYSGVVVSLLTHDMRKGRYESVKILAHNLLTQLYELRRATGKPIFCILPPKNGTNNIANQQLKYLYGAFEEVRMKEAGITVIETIRLTENLPNSGVNEVDNIHLSSKASSKVVDFLVGSVNKFFGQCFLQTTVKFSLLKSFFGKKIKLIEQKHHLKLKINNSLTPCSLNALGNADNIIAAIREIEEEISNI